MLDLTAWQWTGAGFAALLVGMSKAGFGAGAGLLAMPLAAWVLGPELMLPTMLLVLITGDVFSLVHYVKERDSRNLKMLIPGLVVGVGVGYLVLRRFREMEDAEAWLKRLIGALSMAFVVLQCIRMARERRAGRPGAAYVPRFWHGLSIGTCAGATSTLAHAGGPIVALYMIPQRIEKKAFVGTFLRYFLVGNLIKLVPYSLERLMTVRSGLISLCLVPAVVAGTFAGLYLHSKVSDRAFRAAIYVLAFGMGLVLLRG